VLGVRIINGSEFGTTRTRQRNLPAVLPRVSAIVDRPEPRMPQWSDRPDASSFRGHLIDLMV
jgi:hypothetical protein